MQEIRNDLLKKIFGFFDVNGKELHRAAYVNHLWKNVANSINQDYKQLFEKTFPEIFDIAVLEDMKERDWRREFYWACQFANKFPTAFDQIRHRRYNVQWQNATRRNNFNSLNYSGENKHFFEGIAENNARKLRKFKTKCDPRFSLINLLQDEDIKFENFFSRCRPCVLFEPEAAAEIRSIIWSWILEEERATNLLLNSNVLLELAVITHQDQDILEIAVHRGAKNYFDVCRVAVCVNNVIAMNFFVTQRAVVRAKDFNTLLKDACQNACFDVLKYLLANPEYRPSRDAWICSDFLIFLACDNYYPELLRFLLGKFKISETLLTGDGESNTLLHAVSWDDENEPVEQTEYFGDNVFVYIAKILVEELGAEVNPVGDYGRTPLHWACYCVNLKLIEYLLSKKATIDAEDVSGTKPFDLFFYEKSSWCLGYLEKKQCPAFFRIIFFKKDMPANHKKLFLKNCIESINTLDEPENIEFWNKISAIYQTEIVPLCHDDPELLLCCAMITQIDMREIERILKELSSFKPETVALANKCAIPIENYFYTTSSALPDINDIIDEEGAGYDSDTKRRFDP